MKRRKTIKTATKIECWLDGIPSYREFENLRKRVERAEKKVGLS